MSADPAPAVQHRVGSVKTNSPRRSLRVAVVLNWLNFAVYTGGAFLLTPIVLSKLGASGFGMWVLVQSISGYYGLVNMGIGAALARFVTRDITLRDFASLGTTLSTVSAFFAATGLVVLLLAVTLRGSIAELLAVPVSDRSLFGLTMTVTAVGVVADFFAVVVNSLIGACEKYQISTGLSISRQALYVVSVLGVLQYTPTFLAVACVSSGVAILSLLLNTIIARRLVPEAQISATLLSKCRLRELLGFGAGSALLTIANLVRLRMGNFVVARYSGVSAVAGYSIAAGLITNFSTIISSSTSMLGVRFTRLVSAGDIGELRLTYRKSLFVSSALSFGIGVHMLFYGEAFLRFWLKRDMPETVEILQILVFSYMFALAQSPSWGMMLSQAKHHFMARVTVVESIANVVVGIYLAKAYGALGFALATAATMLFTKLTIHPLYGAKIGKLSLRGYLSPMLYPSLTAALFVVVMLVIDILNKLRHVGFLGFFLAGASSVALYFVVVLFAAHRKDYFPPFMINIMRRLKVIM